MNKKIEITCPANNEAERQYIVDVLFRRFLGLDYVLKFSEAAQAYSIVYGEKKLLIEDHFFNLYPDALSYYSPEAIPASLTWLKTEYMSESLPVIYGRNRFVCSSDVVECGLDIFASSFFMLTRWEEYVLGRREKGKCDEGQLFCVKNGIYMRPVVNEYVELLAVLLGRMGVEVKTAQRFSMKITHDVDRCYLTGWKELAGNVRSMLSKGQKAKAKALLKDFCWYKLFMPHPFQTFNMFMDLSEAHGFKDEFYFKACVAGERGYTYSCSEPSVAASISEILSRGHVVGFHPSENTFRDGRQFGVELERLSRICSQPVRCGRNHGLYVNTDTLEDWAVNGCKSVSNWGFQQRMGFRCGVCYPFPLFDNQKRKTLAVMEYPFILMDTVLLRTMPEQDCAFKEMASLIDRVKHYEGTVCINWHTNVYNMPKMRKYRVLYKNLLAYAGTKMN